jgi:hypothetical protein
MPVQLNHTIAGSRDPVAGAAFMTEILGLPAATQFGPFQVVETTNGVSIDFMDWGGNEIVGQRDACRAVLQPRATRQEDRGGRRIGPARLR